MRILEIREKEVPLRAAIRNAVIEFREMTVSAVAVISDIERRGSRVVGFGFNSNGRYAQSGIVQRRMIPRILSSAPEELLSDSSDNFDPFKIWQVMMRNEKPGGHGDRASAVGALDMAVWDLAAKIAQKPLYQFLADELGDGRYGESVEVYAAGGYYYPGKGLRELQDEIRTYLESGYRKVKIKIGGAPLSEDLARIETVLEVLEEPSSLAVDANGRFTLAKALAYARVLSDLPLYWFEEPGDPLDYQLLSEFAAQVPFPVATGENLFSHQDVRNLLRYGGLRAERDVLQMDPALSYGLVEYLRMLDVLKTHGWSAARCFPHGGHQFALHIAAALGLGGCEAYPGVFQPFGGFGDNVPIVYGRVRIPEAPGIGIEERGELFAIFQELAS